MRRVFIFLGMLLFMGSILYGQQINISGAVTDAADGATLPGVTVVVKGTTIGTVTDIDGRYEINAAPDATLVFSFIGMTSQEIPVEGRNVINVSMESALVGLEEVVVMAYGTQRRDAVTGAISSVGSERIEQIPMASFDQILQGQTPGVSSISSSGRPGAGSTVRIRGVGTINSGAQPLYVVDGVPLNVQLNSIYDNPLSGINPNDIESITVLKDASASAIYGSRAANGVILVTTKRGAVAERSQLVYRGQYGISNMARNEINLMNTEQKLQFERDNGLYPNRTDAEWDSLSLIDTDWRAEIFSSNAITQSHELASSGGSDRTRYFVSGSYFTQDGLLSRSDYERLAGRLNLDHFITDNLKFGLSFNASFEKSNYTLADYANNNVFNPVFSAYRLNPYEQPKDEDGEWLETFATWAGNPLRELDLNQDYNETLKLLGNLFVEYEPIDNLTLRTSLGTDFLDYIYDDYLHPTSIWGSGLDGRVARGFRRAQTTTFSNTARYNYMYQMRHSFSLLAGFETTQYDLETFALSGEGFANDKVRVPSAAAGPFSIGGSGSAFTVMSYLSQFNYGLDQKYFLDLSFRRDGSSRFGRDNRYANFWSAGLSWNINREDFMENIDFITDLRLRASYGTTGNYSIGNYEHLGLYSVSVSYNQRPGSVPIRPANPNLTWERSEAFNLGLETRFFDRVGLNLELYQRITKDMLLDMPVSRTSGFTGERRNVGQMTNKGVELAIDADLINIGSFRWNIDMNFTYNHSNIDELYLDVEEFVTGVLIVQTGQPLGTFHFNRYAGVNPANGKPLWYDQYGNLTDQLRDDDAVTLEGKSYLPPYFGGFNSTMNFGNFQIRAFFTFVLDKWMLNNTKFFIGNQSTWGNTNQIVEVLEAWSEPGDIAHFPKYGLAPNAFDDKYIEEASFLRLRNLSLSYTLPMEMANRARLQSVRLYVQGQNLWTLSDYSGFDPEFPGAVELSAYPAARTITFGIDLGI